METSEFLRRAKGRYERGHDTAGYAIHSVARNSDEEMAARKFMYLANPTPLQRFDRAIALAEKAEESRGRPSRRGPATEDRKD